MMCKLNRTNTDNHESQIQAMRDEMASMRQLLEHQLSGLRSEDMARKDPTERCC